MIHPLRPRWLRRALPLVMSAALFILIPACGDDDPANPGDDGEFNGTITISGTSFSPRNVTIKVNETVTWVWSGGTHSVTHGTDPNVSETRLFDEGPKSTGSFTFAFDAPGSYPYFCRPHFTMGMTGTITVEP